VGFALWIDGQLAWAQGTHEYKPMGAAVIGVTDLFGPRDFSPHRRCPLRSSDRFQGLFASLSEVNAYLVARRSQGKREKLRRHTTRSFPII
jgi:hypothetical protein